MFRERQKRNLIMEEQQEEEGENQILEINLISAQGLKAPSGNLRRMQTYALAWVVPTTKLRTRIDRVAADNPTWNDKFLFRVSSDFIASETSGVAVEIYAVGYIRDYLIGTVRFLLSSCLGKFPASADTTGTPAFTAVQIRRPSGRFHGVLNIAASVCSSSSDFEIFNGASAISFRDLMGDEIEKGKEDDRRRRRRLSRIGSKRSEQSSGGESCDFDFSSLDLSSDGAESTTSSSSTASNALKEWNGVRTEVAGKLKEMKNEGVRVVGGGLLCGLMLRRKNRLNPSDHNLHFWDESLENENP